MNTVEQAHNALKDYENGVYPIFPDMDIHDFALWQCVFEDHPTVWIDLELTNNRKQAIKCLKNYPESKEVIACLAHGNIEHLTPTKVATNFQPMLKEAQIGVIKVWLDIFKDYPEFVPALKKANDLHAEYFPDEAKLIWATVQSVA